MRRALAALAALAIGAAAAAPAIGARPARESWAPKKAKKACAVKRRSCRRWRLAFPRALPVPGQEPLAGALPGGESEPPELTPSDPLGRSLQVRADEYSLTLSRNVVAAGDVTIEFNTVYAEDPHDLRLRDGSGDERTLFAETPPELVPPPRQAFAIGAGDYVLFCSLPGHEQLGMRAELDVSPAP